MQLCRTYFTLRRAKFITILISSSACHLLPVKLSGMAPKVPGGAKSSSKTTKPKRSSKKSSSTAPSSSRPKSSSTKRPPAQQVKTKPGVHNPTKPKKKRKVYTEKELSLPALNMITPVGVQKPRGKKKGKIFVDDRESMMTILAMVNAEKEGQIESKMMKARQMEAIRDARRKEAEVRQERKNEKFEATKNSFKRKSQGKGRDLGEGNDNVNGSQDFTATKKSKKRVSFA